MHISEIQTDLMEPEPVVVELPDTTPFDTIPPDSQFDYWYLKLQEHSKHRRRQLTLYYAYMLGQFIETCTVRSRKTHYKSLMTTHFYVGCIRVYYLFLSIGVAQIFRTKLVDFVTIKKLKATEYQSLCQSI